MSFARTHHQFSLEDYEQMIDNGIHTENDRVELLRGEIIEKISIGELHAACVRILTRLLAVRLGDQVLVSIQNPIRLQNSVPEPDVAILNPRADFYAKSHPRPEDVLLVIEVADASLDFDRVVKGEIYAENGVSEYWIVNLIERTLEVHRNPLASGQYGDVRFYSSEESVEVAAIPGFIVTVGEFLPSAAS